MDEDLGAEGPGAGGLWTADADDRDVTVGALAVAGPVIVLTAARTDSGELVDFTVAALNAAAVALLERPWDALVGANLSDLGDARVDGSFFSACRTVVEEGTPFRGVVEWFDGDRTYVDVHVTRRGDGCVVAGWDRTESHLAEEVLEVVDAAADAVVSFDPEGCIVFWSRAAERMYGWTAADAFGQPASILAPDGRSRELDSAIADSLGGDRRVFEATHSRRDGTEFPVEITSAPIRDPRGAVLRIATVHRNVTERVAARAALEQSERRHRLLVENSRDAFTVSVGGVIQWASTAFGVLMGMDVDELIGSDLIERIHPDDHPALEAVRARIDAEMGEQAPLQLRVRHIDGSWHWVDLRVGPLIDDDGEAIGAVSVWRLVDDQVAYVDALARSEAHNRELAAQLQRALDSRVLIEQAKGMVANQRGVSPDEAFELIRDHGRRHHQKLMDVAHAVVELRLRP